MSVGLSQLISPGKDLRVLLGEDFTPWRMAFRTYRNFALESVRQDFITPALPGTTTSCILGRHGDLLCGAVMQIKAKKKANVFPRSVAAYHPAEAIIDEISLYIGSELIERHTKDWFRVWDQLFRTPEEHENYTKMSNFDPATLTTATESTQILYLPFLFAFCRHPSSALPLINLPLSEIRITVTFATAESCGMESFECCLYADYAYLDHSERTLFSKAVKLDYLVEHVQIQEFQLPDDIYSDTVTAHYNAKLPFRRPIKSLHWVLRHDPKNNDPERTHHGRYVGDVDTTYLSLGPCPWISSGLGLIQSVPEKLAPIHSVSLVFNGTERFSERLGTYFNTVQHFNHGLGCPLPGIYSYCFALNPADPIPSGAASFSTLDEVELRLVLKKNRSRMEWDGSTEDEGIHLDSLRTLVVFGFGYNVLHIEGGGVSVVFG